MNNEVIKENFSFLNKKQADLDNLKATLLSDLAKNCADLREDITIDDVINIYKTVESKSSSDLAVYCKSLIENVEIISQLFNDDVSDGDADDHIQIAYLKNAFSDKAYRKFSELFPKASAAYYPGFREVCEEVYYGRCSHAILPIYSTTEGHIATFRKLITKYDLKIICATDVLMSDESVMRYALLAKDLLYVNGLKNLDYLELSLVCDNTVKCGEFLSGTECLGALVASANSYPLEYSTDSNILWLEFNISKADPIALCLYFECYQVRYTIIGAYKLI